MSHAFVADLVTRGILDTKKGVYGRGGVWWWRSDGHMTLSGHMTYHPIGDWQDYREAKTWHPACPQALTNRVEQTSDRNRTDCSACQQCW